jgi:hypothetical protein
MNNTFKMSSPLGKRMPDMSIDWEFQPSLHHLVVRTDEAHPDMPVWAETMPATLDSLAEPAPFHEPLEGLSIREVNEPEIFQVFFGAAGRATARG